MESALLLWALALTVLMVAGILWVLDLRGRVLRLDRRLESVFNGEEDEDSGTTLGLLTARLSRMNARVERQAAQTRGIEKTLLHSVQGMGMVRFSAYADTGGDQSFSLALVDGEGDGVVLSGLYARDATRVYAKPIEGWRSPRSLTGEEELALSKARGIVVPDLD